MVRSGAASSTRDSVQARGETITKKELALARLEAGVLLVDDIGAAAAADDATVLVALLKRAERVADFHGTPFVIPMVASQTDTTRQGGAVLVGSD